MDYRISKTQKSFIDPSTGKQFRFDANKNNQRIEKGIMDLKLHKVGKNWLFVVDQDLKVPNFPLYRKRFKNMGYEIHNNIVIKPSKYYPVSDRQAIGVGRLNRMTYNIRAGALEPVNISEFYDQVLRTAIILFANDDRLKHSIHMVVRVLNEDPNVRTVGRSIRMYNKRVFTIDIEKILEGISIAGSDPVADGSIVDSSWFELYYLAKENQGGGSDNKTSSVNSKYYFAKNIKTIDNNCLIGALKLATKDKRFVKSIRKELVNKGIPEKTLIKISEIPIIEEYFGKTIGILSDDAPNDYLYKKVNNPEISILLKDNHYSLILKKKKLIEKKQDREKLKDLLLFFDLETIFDRNDLNYLKPYSISWYVHNPDHAFNYSEESHNKVRHHVGFDCINHFISFIRGCPKGMRYILIGFNNSKFDNYFVADCASRELCLSNIFYVNNSILDMNIMQHNTMDLRKFLPPNLSLKKVCEAFKTNPKKMDGFSHTEVQEAFDNNKLVDWLEDNKDKLKEYNDLDVLCLCDATLKLNASIKELTGREIWGYKTQGQFVWDQLKIIIERTFGKDSSLVIPRPQSLEDDNFIRKAMTAGRTQAYYGKLYINHKLAMVDACSLYPTVMMDNLYPIGDYKKTKKYIKNKLGIYKCHIEHQNSKWMHGKPPTYKNFEYLEKEYAPIIFPLRSETLPLDWDFRGSQDVVLCSIDIEEIKYYCGEDSIEVFEGIYWEESSNKVFKEYIEFFRKEKNKQDKLDKKGDKDYNPVLREVCKLMLNTPSGKVGQRNYTECIQRIYTEKDVDKFMEKIDDKESVKVCSLSKELLFMKGKLKEEDCYKDSAKPSYLAIFIYAYARKFMYRNILSKYTVLYQDTDSALILDEEYQRLMKEQPELFGVKDFGKFEQELNEADKCIIISPKNYYVNGKPKDGKDKCKRRFKGVKSNDTYLLSSELPQNYDSSMNEKLLKKSHPCMTEEMFKLMFEEKEIIIFTNQLKRKVQFTDTKDKKGGIFIQQQFLTKVFNYKN